VAAQILPQADGRNDGDFLNTNGRARLCNGEGEVRCANGSSGSTQASDNGSKLGSAISRVKTEKERLSERAHQDRDIVYFLKEPESHAFRCITITRSRGRG